MKSGWDIFVTRSITKKYIKKYHWSSPSTFKLVQLLLVENRKELCNLGKFIHLACKARNNLVWLTCVFIIIVHNFLTYLCYFLICHIYTATFLDLVCYLVFLPVATSKLPFIPHRSPVLLFFVNTIFLVQILY
jgi:hypothetical protein